MKKKLGFYALFPFIYLYYANVMAYSCTLNFTNLSTSPNTSNIAYTAIAYQTQTTNDLSNHVLDASAHGYLAAENTTGIRFKSVDSILDAVIKVSDTSHANICTIKITGISTAQGCQYDTTTIVSGNCTISGNPGTAHVCFGSGTNRCS